MPKQQLKQRIFLLLYMLSKMLNSPCLCLVMQSYRFNEDKKKKNNAEIILSAQKTLLLLMHSLNFFFLLNFQTQAIRLVKITY